MKYIRETVLRDIMDLIDTLNLKNDDIGERIKNKTYKNSISTATKDLVMTFPVLCTNTIDPEVATMISKAHEKKCVALLQMLFASSWKTSAKDAGDFIAGYHKNLQIDLDLASVDDVINYSGKLESGNISIDEERAVSNDARNAMNERYLPMESYNNKSLQEFRITDSYNGIKVDVLREANHPYGTDESHRQGKAGVEQINRDNNKKEKKKLSTIERREKISKTDLNYSDIFHKQLLDTDIRKANEAVPALLIVRFNGSDDNGKNVYRQAIVGVKSRLIAVDSAEIIDRIYVKNTDRNWLLKLIRATSREISFTKDFLLAIDRAKIDAISGSKKGSNVRIWKALERRATKNKLRKATRNKNDATAITTLVVSMDEVDYIDRNYNINLRDVHTARDIMESYNLLAFMIVDTVSESVNMLYDGEESYEMLSFNNLEKESNNGGGAYKQVLNMMNKLNSRM